MQIKDGETTATTKTTKDITTTRNGKVKGQTVTMVVYYIMSLPE